MGEQLMLTSFGEKPADAALQEFKPYNNIIIDYELEYRDYSDERGLIERVITVFVKEALVKHEQKEVAGFVVVVIQEDSFADSGG